MLNINKLKLYVFLQWIVLWGLTLGKYTELFASLIVIFISIQNNKGHISTQRKLLFFFSLLFIHAAILIFINGYQFGKFVQQYLLFTILLFGYGQLFFYYVSDIKVLFEKYLKLIYILCILGIIQFLFCLLLKIDIFPFTLDGYIQSIPGSRIMRVHSILSEPGNLGTLLLPAVGYMFFKTNFYRKNKLKCIVFLVTTLLTFASISYVMLTIISSVYLIKKYRFLRYISLPTFFIIIPLVINLMASNIERTSIDHTNLLGMIQKKMIQTLEFSKENSIEDYENLNASSYALLTNLSASLSAPNRLCGTGLGTHQQNYFSAYPHNDFYIYGLNSQDGYSLFVRIFSEFGWIGIVLYFMFLIRFYNKKEPINISVLFLFIALLIRGGHYTLYGTILFHVIYFYSSKVRVEEKK